MISSHILCHTPLLDQSRDNSFHLEGGVFWYHSGMGPRQCRRCWEQSTSWATPSLPASSLFQLEWSPVMFSCPAPLQHYRLSWVGLISLAQRLLCLDLAQQMFSPEISIQAEESKESKVPSSDDRCQGEGTGSWLLVQRPGSPLSALCSPLLGQLFSSSLVSVDCIFPVLFSIDLSYQVSIFQYS